MTKAQSTDMTEVRRCREHRAKLSGDEEFGGELMVPWVREMVNSLVAALWCVTRVFRTGSLFCL